MFAKRIVHHFKFLPWRSLIGMTLLTFAIVSVIDFGLSWGFESSSLLQGILTGVFTFPGSLLAMVGVGMGIGALAVLLLETLRPRLPVQVSTLWAFILCLLVGLWVKTLLHLPGLLVIGFSQSLLVGLVLGVFWKGRRHWR